MPAQGNEATLVRRKTGDDTDSFDETAVNLLFDEAESNYIGYSRKVIFQAVVLARLEENYVSAARAVSYKKGDSSENLSDIAKALDAMIKRARAELERMMIDEDGPAVAMGVIRKVPGTLRDEP